MNRVLPHLFAVDAATAEWFTARVATPALELQEAFNCITTRRLYPAELDFYKVSFKGFYFPCSITCRHLPFNVSTTSFFE
jgi:hypothetical protein